MSLGQMPTLKSNSFCCLEMRVASTFFIMELSFSRRLSLALELTEWMLTGAPRKVKVLSPMYGMACPFSISLGS